MKLDDEGRKKAQIMRCLGCGAEMILLKVVPDTNMMVTGYEHHTLQCSGCYEVEQRLIFSQRNESSEGENRPNEPVSPRPAAVPPPAPAQAVAASQPAESVANGKATVIPAPVRAASAWRRAVEKVRIQQAGLNERLNGRTEADRKANQFNQDWENLASSQRGAPAAKQETSGSSDQEHGGEAPPAQASNEIALHPRHSDGAASAERIDLTQGFDRVWENLVPHRGPAAATRGVDGGESRSDQPPAS
jgi:hypothetical protein